MIASIGEGVERDVLAGLLGKAVAKRGHEALVRANGEPEEARRVAHKLRGTAGSFGLACVADLAGAVEDRAARGEEVGRLLGELADAIAATREELGTLATPSPR